MEENILNFQFLIALMQMEDNLRERQEYAELMGNTSEAQLAEEMIRLLPQYSFTDFLIDSGKYN